MIGEREVQAYKQDGVIVVPDVLDSRTLARMRQVVAELVAGAAGTTEHTDLYDLEPGHTPADPRVRRIKAPHKVHAVFDEVVRSPEVIAILKALLGPGLRLHGSKLNMKSAHYGSPVEWHQDWAFYPHTNFYFLNNPYGNVITSTFTAWFGEKFYILGFLPAIALALVLMYAPWAAAGKKR